MGDSDYVERWWHLLGISFSATVQSVGHGQAIFRKPRLLAWALATSTLSWVAQLAGIYWTLKAYSLPVGVGAAGVVFLASNLVQLFPITPGNLGVFQAATATLLAGLYPSIGTHAALTFSIGLQLIEALLGVGVGFVFLSLEGLSVGALRSEAEEDEEKGEPASPGFVALIALAAVLAGCSGGGSGSSGSTTSSASTTGVAPSQKAVVAKPGTTLSVGDISVKMLKMQWERQPGVKHAIPGTRIYAVVSLRVTNNGTAAGTVTPTQFWLLDVLHREYLAAAKNDIPNPLVGQEGRARARASNGTLVFGVPRKLTAGFVLAYQFKDAKSIAKATEVGLLQFGG